MSAKDYFKAVPIFSVIIAGSVATAALAKTYSDWSAPVIAEDYSRNNGAPNSPQGEGCPILDPYTNDLYIASGRPGGEGGLDIWIAHWNGEGWDEPINPGFPINTSANEYCPTPARGNRLFFVSTRHEPNGDIYVIKKLPIGWARLDRLPYPVNSNAAEWSPSVFDGPGGKEVLYFSSTRNGGQDIFRSIGFGTPQAVEALNTEFSDARPNVRKDGLEIVFDSDRPGGQGDSDIWTASRSSVSDPWGTPEPITQINSAAAESRATISWDGHTIVFGSSRDGGEGASDIYVATRD